MNTQKFSAAVLTVAAAYMATQVAGLDLDAEVQPLLAERELLAERANREAFALEALCPEGEDPNVWCPAACAGAREAARRLEAADAKLQAAQGAERAEPLRLARLISAKLGLSPLEVALFAMLGGLVTTDPRAPEYGGIEIEPGKYAVGFHSADDCGYSLDGAEG